MLNRSFETEVLTQTTSLRIRNSRAWWQRG